MGKNMEERWATLEIEKCKDEDGKNWMDGGCLFTLNMNCTNTCVYKDDQLFWGRPGQSSMDAWGIHRFEFSPLWRN